MNEVSVVESELTGSSIKLLTFLQENPDKNFSYADISKRVNLSKKNLWRTVKPLEERKLVKKFKIAKEAYIAITPKGKSYDFTQDLADVGNLIRLRNLELLKKAFYQYHDLFEQISALFVNAIKNKKNYTIDIREFTKLQKDIDIDSIKELLQSELMK